MKQLQEFEQKIDALGELYLIKKAPFQIPENGKEIIVKYGPYITLVLLIVSSPLIFFVNSIGSIFTPFGVFAGYSTGLVFSMFINSAISLVELVITIIALPGLFKRQLSSWRLMWYSSWLSILIQLINFHLIPLIFTLLITFYFLYQIKSYYHQS